MKRKNNPELNQEENIQEAEQQETNAAHEEELDFAQNSELNGGAQNSLSIELTRLQQELQESQERFLRTQADFDNFRRRSRQEKEEFAKYASSKVMESLLPVVDNFGRALESGKETNDLDALIKGLDMIYRQLDQVMEQEGVKRMETVGLPFNPEYHQAIMQVESDEYEEGIVVEELVQGYMIGDRVLRAAMVKVSS